MKDGSLLKAKIIDTTEYTLTIVNSLNDTTEISYKYVDNIYDISEYDLKKDKLKKYHKSKGNFVNPNIYGAPFGI